MREITISVRVSPEEKRLIEQGAQRQKLQPSTYMRRLALLESEKALAMFNTFVHEDYNNR